MLLVVAPGADVLGAVSPNEGPFSILLSVLEVTLVTTSVVPGLNAPALDTAKTEFTLIYLVHICKIVLALALELSIDELALVVAAVSPFEASLALLFALKEVPLVARASTIFAPDLLAEAMLSVVQPLACISYSLNSVKEGALPCRLVCLPEAHVDIAVRLGHLAPALEHSVAEHSLISGAIWIQLLAHAIFLVRREGPAVHFHSRYAKKSLTTSLCT